MDVWIGNEINSDLYGGALWMNPLTLSDAVELAVEKTVKNRCLWKQPQTGIPAPASMRHVPHVLS